MKEKFARWLGPEQWLSRIGLVATTISVGATTTVMKGWWDLLRSSLSSKLSAPLLLDTVSLLLLGLLLMVLSWWFYARAVRFRMFGFMEHTPRRFRKIVMSVLRDIVSNGNDDSKIAERTEFSKDMVNYAMNELRYYGWVVTHVEEWGDPSVYHIATPNGRKAVIEATPTPKK